MSVAKCFIGSIVALIAVAAASAGTPVDWDFDLSTDGADVVWVSPTAVAADADQFDTTTTITLVEIVVGFSIFEITVDVTDQVPPEFLVTELVLPGPAPILLVDQGIAFPEPPEPPSITGSLRVEIDGAGFGRASFTNVTLGQLMVEFPPFGIVNADVREIRVTGSVTVDPQFFVLLGDMNCDGAVTVGDINAFVLALVDPDGYDVMFPDCNLLNGDFSDDGQLTVADINGFVAALTDGS